MHLVVYFNIVKSKKFLKTNFEKIIATPKAKDNWKSILKKLGFYSTEEWNLQISRGPIWPIPIMKVVQKFIIFNFQNGWSPNVPSSEGESLLITCPTFRPITIMKVAQKSGGRGKTFKIGAYVQI